ncbi:hypothetical protein CXB51_026422 [Gossypium anomalum]|uniref:Uncharacterized protein n=1 Tax=Gossypium anomalum TaxID=47600 RepID=A0A8J5YBW2_9ROSI|nr:hypothetical protein CXB51_026422 [Gossypium anomalum]
MPWETKIELKKNLYEHNKVFECDDSEAKQRFWEVYHSFPCENKLSSNPADLYINDADWNSEIDPELFSEIKALTNDEDGEKDNDKEMDWFSIPLEEIQATRWDEYEELAPCLPILFWLKKHGRKGLYCVIKLKPGDHIHSPVG